MHNSTDICSMKVEYDLNEVENVARSIWKAFSAQHIWALHGDMGVGKTTFVRALCQSVLESTDNISSPTFALINQYESATVGNICHIDLYRLGDTEEAINAGVLDAIENASLSLIEWPEIAPELFPENTLHLYFSLQDNNKRGLESKLSSSNQ
ncbi:MAG: tRNA (adenosine(37)-N6)-threonylcarbamoyltransferase complex ATPase subunit type 1 TsaE [Pseudopedobacter saltans]|uniref:tRNA threonylcarbamoyladenosine biosynthesis protein TsaE n=1 Tax=Pseudopedobacter saltans TaxID=151895 RepID=A0A2W5F5G9_9SPHI|nr:MAG: tRNA (adenosine(37)-N6)-threonylcarbamoyltransferase complex ATPase subunit type 1 TsaE [Pseudopedobacter saltans]